MSDITEEQVVEWLREKVKSAKPILRVTSIVVCYSKDYDPYFWIHGGGECEYGASIDEASAKLLENIGNPLTLAKEKRADAARMLKEAEELEAAK